MLCKARARVNAISCELLPFRVLAICSAKNLADAGRKSRVSRSNQQNPEKEKQMSGKYNSTVETIGNTPLVRLNVLTKGLAAEVWVKCEFRNPFSVKDRPVKRIVEEAEAAGTLAPGATIIEPTSGNTGIALAAIASAKGYKAVLVMPESMSLERRTLLRMLGAEVRITPKALGMKGAIAFAEKLLAETPKSFALRQFDNPANPAAHYATTGPEIWADSDGDVDAFVAGIGTGGTFSGTVKFLKEKNPALRGIAVEPAGSPVLSSGKPGPHGIQGIGAGFVPANLDRALIDEVFAVEDEAALATARAVTFSEGIPCGISSGANIYAALEIAKRPEFAGKKIATVVADASERYLSTPLAQVAVEEMSALRVEE